MDDESGRAIATDPDHELAEIRLAFDEARAAWPGIDVALSDFAARMSHARSRANAVDLYLACACSDANPLALAEFERRFIGRVREVVVRVDPSYDFVAEVEQILRERLLVGPEAKIRDYRGAGALTGWVQTAALRTALNLRRSSHQKERQARSLEPFDQLLDPEVAFLRQRYAPEIDQALRRALSLLEPDERLLLHFYYVDGLTLARIAAFERVGTTTVFRRLSAAAQKVLARVRTDLAARLQLSAQSLDSLIRLVRHDLDLNVSQILS
jgi:RNA polymerase sigma-70 factor, ECF subfamily